MKFYGLKNCDTCRKAVKELASAGVVFDYVDVRTDGLPEELLAGWLKNSGPDSESVSGPAVLVNRRSTTWRNLSDADKALAETPESAARLLHQYPTLLKRPVIEREGQPLLVGWSDETRRLLGI